MKTWNKKLHIHICLVSPTGLRRRLRIFNCGGTSGLYFNSNSSEFLDGDDCKGFEREMAALYKSELHRNIYLYCINMCMIVIYVCLCFDLLVYMWFYQYRYLRTDISVSIYILSNRYQYIYVNIYLFMKYAA